jgi:A/G-specific adenine glycosylase
MQIDFKKKLLQWNREQNFRDMPWKNETNPYRIWLSEIILQQTRVEQGKAYYNKFISTFPTIRHLAKAPEKKIFKHWEGLGYYSRCRNLIATAKKIVLDYNGQFPSTYNDIRELPGIGPYTAAAIASFAFGLPYAVVDGNVERVLSRYFGVTASASTAAGKKIYYSLAGELLDKSDPASYNQAMMDFGATVCKPRNPLCNECILSRNCQAFKNGWVKDLPKKKKPLIRRERWFYYFIIEAGKNKYWIRERTEKDIWQNLYEFKLFESGQIIPQDRISNLPFFRKHFGKKQIPIKYISPVYDQTLTHQTIHCSFVHLNIALAAFPGFLPVSNDQFRAFPFPKLIADYIEKNSSTLSLW